MSRVLIVKVVTLILIMLSGLILIVSAPNISSADSNASRATPTPVPTSTPLPNSHYVPPQIPILINIEENISVTNTQDQSGIQSGKVIEENISVTDTMNPTDEMLQELANIAEEMESREASREQSSRESTEERDRRDPFGRGTGDVQSDASDSGSCNSPNSNEGLLLFAGLMIPAFLRIRKKVSKKSETQD